MAMITTTLNRIREHSPCAGGWRKLLAHLGKNKPDDEPLPYAVILASNGLDDALWCCRAEPQYAREWRLYAVWCARRVQNPRTALHSINAVDVAERHALGLATDGQLAEAYGEAARIAAKSGEIGAGKAAYWSAERAAYWVASWSASKAASRHKDWDAALDSAKAEQTAEFLRVVGG
jgi:hypothetical protein